MSPGSAGGVYLGPSEKKEKVSSSSSSTTTATPSVQDKKLAEIRSPTDYYTDGNVFIGQGISISSPFNDGAVCDILLFLSCTGFKIYAKLCYCN